MWKFTAATLKSIFSQIVLGIDDTEYCNITLRWSVRVPSVSKYFVPKVTSITVVEDTIGFSCTFLHVYSAVTLFEVFYVLSRRTGALDIRPSLISAL